MHETMNFEGLWPIDGATTKASSIRAESDVKVLSNFGFVAAPHHESFEVIEWVIESILIEETTSLMVHGHGKCELVGLRHPVFLCLLCIFLLIFFFFCFFC